MEVFSETYAKMNPEVFIEVQGPGSSAGIKAAKNGSADIGMSSRNLKDSEKKRLWLKKRSRLTVSQSWFTQAMR